MSGESSVAYVPAVKIEVIPNSLPAGPSSLPQALASTPWLKSHLQRLGRANAAATWYQFC